MRLAINVFALLVVAYVVPGFKLANFQAAIVAAIVIGIINTFVRPILQIISLPISILTFGVFAFLINVFLLQLAAKIVPGFSITSFTSAIIGSIALSLVSWFLNSLAS